MTGVLLVIAGAALLWVTIFASTLASGKDARDSALAATAFLIVMPPIAAALFAALWLMKAGIERLL